MLYRLPCYFFIEAESDNVLEMFIIAGILDRHGVVAFWLCSGKKQLGQVYKHHDLVYNNNDRM